MTTRTDIRNIAVVAHVDHGKTTLVDAMLKQTGTIEIKDGAQDRVMDSSALERERGITILAKNTAILYTGTHAKKYHKSGDDTGITINVIDTPGHADFGGEVERGLSMVDGVVLLVDAAEGPLPQTRFVLRKALEKLLPVVLVINKTDRKDADIDSAVSQTQDLLLGLAEDISATKNDIDIDRILDLPIVYASGRAGIASTVAPKNGELPQGDSLEPLFDVLLAHIPPPSYSEGSELCAQVTNLDYSEFLGRIALLRVYSGEIRKGQQVSWLGSHGAKTVKIVELLKTHGLKRHSTESAMAGDIVAIAGIDEITIGDTICLGDPVPMPRIVVDEPAISVSIGVNSSPLAGAVKGHKLTARLIKERLDRELVGNVSIRVLPTDNPDMWEVQGRGELALAILVENMRREGYELTVGKPKVVTKEIRGALHEPYETATIDTPEEYLGAITQLFASRKGNLISMTNQGTGWVRMEFSVPSRGLIGFRTHFLTLTRGSGVFNSNHAGYIPWCGHIPMRNNGSIVADRAGVATIYAMLGLQERMSFFVKPADEVYEGMVIGQNSRAEDMDVNITREKKLTNVRSSTGEELEKLTPPRVLSLEECLEFAKEDECVEITPEVLRVRKVELSASVRAKLAKKVNR